MRKKKRGTSHRNVVLFPGMLERLLEEGRMLAESFQFKQAVEKYDEAFQYYEGDEQTLSLYALSLYEVKDYVRAKEVCEYLLELGPTSYFESMELYLTVCMHLKQYEQVEKIIQTLLEEDVVPAHEREKFERLKQLNINIVDKKRDEQQLDDWLEQFLTFSSEQQLLAVQQLTHMNVRPYEQQVKQLIEDPSLHPFVASLLLIVLVEQQVSCEIQVNKFQHEQAFNPSKLQLPTNMPIYLEVQRRLTNYFEQEPSTLELVQYMLAKHAIVTYPFEWFDYEVEDIVQGYIDFVRVMFGQVQEMDYEFVEFLQQLEKLTDIQTM